MPDCLDLEAELLGLSFKLGGTRGTHENRMGIADQALEEIKAGIRAKELGERVGGQAASAT